MTVEQARNRYAGTFCHLFEPSGIPGEIVDVSFDNDEWLFLIAVGDEEPDKHEKVREVHDTWR